MDNDVIYEVTYLCTELRYYSYWKSETLKIQ